MMINVSRSPAHLGGLAWLAALALGGCSAGAGASAVAPSAPTSGAASGMDVVAQGELRPIDGTAAGTAQLVTLPDGTYEVILEEFSIASTAHTNVVLVANAEVTQTKDVDKSMLLDLGPLTAASGMQTYLIPAEMAGQVMEGYHSVVIWDTEMAHAIAAAALE